MSTELRFSIIGDVEAASLRVFQSSGVSIVRPERAKSIFYSDNAVLPAAPWSRKDFAKEGWREKQKFDYLNNIGVARIEREYWEPLAQEIERLGNKRELSDKTSTIAPLVQALEEHIVGRFCAVGAWVSESLKSTAPSLLTTAIDRVVGGLAGLHLDAWEGVDFAARRRARTRIAINLGPDVRSFLFVATPIDEMARRLESRHSSEEAVDVIWSEYAERNPGERVLRVDLEPGMAYLAPTDWLVHDGSTMQAKARTFTLQIRGHFSAALTCREYVNDLLSS